MVVGYLKILKCLYFVFRCGLELHANRTMID